ncbi:MAG: hypothetical protein ABIJ56_07705 [Pseudomonadota bacterium]
MKTIIRISATIFIIACAAAGCKDKAAKTPAGEEPAAQPAGPAEAKDDQPAHGPEPGEAPLPGEKFDIALDKPYTTKDGMEILLAGKGHKHAAGGGGVTSNYELTIKKGEETQPFSYSYDSDMLYWYMEGIAFDTLFTVSPPFVADDERRAVTLTPWAGQPLDDDAARDKGREVAKKFAEEMGCKGDGSSSGMPTKGTVLLTVMQGDKPQCTLLVGVYTGRLIDSK